MRRVVTLEAHGFDASEYVWKFAKEAYGSIFQKAHFFSHSRASCQTPNALCMILLVKMKAVWASPGFGFWGISKNPTVRFASKLNQCFLWSLRTHSWSLGVRFHFHQKKMLPDKIGDQLAIIFASPHSYNFKFLQDKNSRFHI